MPKQKSKLKTFKFIPDFTLPKGAFELTMNYRFLNREKVTIRSITDAVKYAREYCYSDNIEFREMFFLLMLDQRNGVFAYKLLSFGSKTGTVVDTSLLLLAAVMSQASGIILLHNHPSGDPTPSGADLLLTKRIKKAAQLFEIKLHDHIILTIDGFHSMAKEGKVL